MEKCKGMKRHVQKWRSKASDETQRDEIELMSVDGCDYEKYTYTARDP